ncbi:hypothetical protein NN561_002095 [Cricetulus griseus]
MCSEPPRVGSGALLTPAPRESPPLTRPGTFSLGFGCASAFPLACVHKQQLLTSESSANALVNQDSGHQPAPEPQASAFFPRGRRNVCLTPVSKDGQVGCVSPETLNDHSAKKSQNAGFRLLVE